LIAEPVRYDRALEDLGRGGGYGRYSGLTLAEIESRFDLCVADPSMRSISAVLRLTREQIDARGHLGHFPTYAILMGAVVVICAVGLPFLPEFRQAMLGGLAGSSIIWAILMFGVVRLRDVRRSNLEQEMRIRRAALVALTEILAKNPPLKPLTREQRDTTIDIYKRCKADPGSAEVLARLRALP
jgi:hypothetical protein